MLTKPEIINKSIKIGNVYFSGVYFLILNCEVVYVGQTTSGVSRIFHHKKNKEFDSYYYIECEERDLIDLESRYIAKLLPVLNREFGDSIKGYTKQV